VAYTANLKRKEKRLGPTLKQISEKEKRIRETGKGERRLVATNSGQMRKSASFKTSFS